MVWGEEGVASGRRRFEWGRGLNGGCGQWGGWLERGRGFGGGGVAARRLCVGRGRGHREGGKAGTQFQLELPHFLSAIFSAHGPIFSAYGLIFSAYGPNFRACGPISAL